MTREHAKAEREAFNAFCDGKEIEQMHIASIKEHWESCKNPTWSYEYMHRIKPTPRMVPLGPEDVPPGSAIRLSEWGPSEWETVISVHGDTIQTYQRKRTFSEILHWFISRDNGRTWQRAEKEDRV